MRKIEVSRIHSLTGHRDAVYALELGKGVVDIFSAGGDGNVVKWNMESPEDGELIAKLPNSVYSIHYLNNQNLLVAGQNFEGVHLLDYQLRKEIASVKISTSYIFDIQSHENDLIIAGGDGVVTIVDLKNWEVKGRIPSAGKSARTIAINTGRFEFAVGYSDNKIRIYSLKDYNLKKEWQAHTNSIFTVKFTPGNRYLLSGSRDARLKVWDSFNDYAPIQDIVAHMYTINHIEFSPDGKHFVTCSMDKSIKVWDTDEFKLLKVIDKARHAGHGTSVNKLAWTSFSNQLVSASDDRTLSVWEIIF